MATGADLVRPDATNIHNKLNYKRVVALRFGSFSVQFDFGCCPAPRKPFAKGSIPNFIWGLVKDCLMKRGQRVMPIAGCGGRVPRRDGWFFE